ncbi:MAG TPA: hypothetical protein VMX55_13435 [candidate division Zixibacteria bacterium]|nr:hypothetical protein [candidate division Zixibacteria bacterium]
MDVLKSLPLETEALQHISNVLEERVILYKKRSIETKRAIKAMHRANLQIDPLAFQIMLEAEIYYEINFAGKKTIDEIISSENNLGLSIIPSQFLQRNYLVKIFLNHIKNSNNTLSKIKVESLETIFDVVFSLNEDFQRLIIRKVIFYNLHMLIEIIFKNITIIDDEYKEKAIYAIQNYLKNRIQLE